MSLQEELTAGLEKMKFAINHSYKFKDYTIAYFTGFGQSLMIVFVQTVNLVAILNYTTSSDVVICFLGYAIIADFDNHFYNALGDSPDKELITEDGYDELLFTIRKTSSRNANANVTENEFDCPAYSYLKEPQFEDRKFRLDRGGETQHIYIGFKDRSFSNKLLYIIYRVFRTIHVSFWFYFFPLLGVLGSFYVPLFI